MAHHRSPDDRARAPAYRGHGTSAEPGEPEEPDHGPGGPVEAGAGLSVWDRPFYAVTIGLAPLLFLFVHNSHSAGLRDLLPPAIAVIVAGVVLLWFFRRLYDDRHRAGLAAAIVLVGFMVYGHVFNVVSFLGLHDLFLYQLFGLPARNPGLWLAWGIFLGLAAWGVKKLPRLDPGWTKVLNIMGVGAVLIPLSSGAGALVGLGGAEYDLASAAGIEDTSIQVDGPKRDIYLIILDAYAGVNGLEETFGFDNRPFVADLESRGFYVARNSTSNYQLSDQSIPATLNMMYMQQFADRVGGTPFDGDAKRQMIRYGAVMQFLDDQGYYLRSINSEWAPTSTNPWADENVYCGSFNEFQLTFMKTTMFRMFAPYLAGEDKRERVHCQFAALGNVAQREQPTFTFAHLMMPHSPIVFQADGSAFDDPNAAELNRGWAAGPYLGQLEYTSTRTLDVVDEILAAYQGRPDPIILIQGDHGSAVGFDQIAQVDGLRGTIDPDQIDSDAYVAAARERASILNAYYLPDAPTADLYDDITPVNSFRVVFDAYFGTHLGLVEDRVYLSTYGAMYDWYDVTEAVRGDP